ncbi:MAG TPA: FtsL-like putative cell division protein [Bacteroidota bacterium]|nr:FtsL-like putative cell division protein [Bacteroidota bacterium]
MAKVYRNSAEVLAERAMSPDPPQQRERPQPQAPKTQQRRMIYSGTMPIPPQAEMPQGTTLPPVNRKYTQRKISPFNIILILMGSAAAIVLYISNVIAVNQLVNDIHKSEVRLQEIQSDQEALRARINQMSSLEKIRKRAEEELGLKNPADVPGWIEVDQEKIRTIEEATREH